MLPATPGPVEMTDPLDRVTKNDYCDPNTLQSQQPPLLDKCLVSEHLESFTDPKGIKTVLAYDGYRNIAQARRIPVHVDDLAGRLECTAVRINPAIFANPPASACALGQEGSYGPDRITRNFYDDAGQLLKVTEGYGTSIAADVRSNSYTATGQIQTLTDGCYPA